MLCATGFLSSSNLCVQKADTCFNVNVKKDLLAFLKSYFQAEREQELDVYMC